MEENVQRWHRYIQGWPTHQSTCARSSVHASPSQTSCVSHCPHSIGVDACQTSHCSVQSLYTQAQGLVAMAEPLNLQSCIGFQGQTQNGLMLHPDGRTMIYPLGSTIVLRDKKDAKAQEFLQGHTDRVSCLALSPTGRYLASGQITYMGFTADIIIWDLETRYLVHRLQLQKVKIQALAFSADESMLASLGGQDDNSLVLWNVATGEAICGSPTHQDFVLCCRFFNTQNDKLITAGNYNLQIWTYDAPNNKLRSEDVKLGNFQRQFRSLVVSQQDKFAYVGSTSGDVMQVSLDHALLRNTGPAKHPLQLSVTAAAESPAGTILLGSGDGTLALLSPESEPSPVNPKQLKKLATLTSLRVEGGITSIVIDQESTKAVPLGRNPTGGGIAYTAYVGTDRCNIYKVAYDPINNKFTEDIIQTAHSEKINSMAFPAQYGEVFATCSAGSIRIWHLAGCRELLRINLPNLECKCVTFAPDGKTIVSGWSDGKIRGFGPQSGKLLYTINDAHHKAVTAIACTSDSSRIVSGGEEGMVRIWRLGKQSQTMEASMKDHKGPVNCIVVKASTDDECVSASSDGSCIIWDMAAGRRRQSLFANTFFLGVVYHPDESQIVTAGTDRKITYWDAYDGQAIRIIEGSDSAQLNALATDPEGEALLSGGSDKLVKLWGYDEGHCYYVGVGHSGEVTSLAVAPDKSAVVSVGAEGGIFIWDYQRPPVQHAD